MDQIEKFLRRLTPKERRAVKEVLEKLKRNELRTLDIKKLKDRNDIFRIRKGTVRIIYWVNEDQKISVLSIERRSDNTYK